MMDFFRGWKRKVGCLTLVMACVFMAGGARSELRFDTLEINGGETTLSISSLGGEFHWVRVFPPYAQRSQWYSGKLTEVYGFQVDGNGVREQQDFWEGADVEWRTDWAGFHFGGGVSTGGHAECYCIPYWSIVIPLTLFSAYLLLSKPHKPSPEKIPEPTTNEGA